ncbi:hypothetical protein CAEBREN_20710 [Caenorhabditis brenneri]|uniref:Uncharacterized protein n=1 Tax=Caenorhabditis brenneri TaxID=135651 RepID=G0NJU2_CAEBE|nr:hypothetical protein CAEBREN_20710 [Caenorhabditis brenneri]
MMRKRKQNLPHFYLPPLVYDGPEIVEDYHRRLVVLFVPWADEEYIRDAFGCESHIEVWMAYLRELKIRSPEAHADLTKLLEGYTRIQNAEAKLAKRMESIKKARKELQIDEEDEDLLKIQRRKVEKTRHKRNKRKLNEVQLEIFNEIINGRGPSAYGRKYGRNWTQAISQLFPNLKILKISGQNLPSPEFRVLCDNFPNLTLLDISATGLVDLTGIVKLQRLEQTP